MSIFPKDPKKIQATITRYEKAFQKEQQRYGAIDDGAGKRYLLGILYLLKGDLEGSLRSFTWVEQTFPDDVGEPGQYLCWTLALYQAGHVKAATQKLLHTMLMNLSLLPSLLGIDQPHLDIWQGSSDTSPAYVHALPQEVFQLWDQTALTWAADTYQSERFQQIRTRYIEIYTQLKSEPVGPTRSQLVKDASMLRNVTLE